MANTQDAKTFLSEEFPHLPPGQWKRVRKFKNDDGQWVRQFEHKSGERVALVENDKGFQVQPDNPGRFSKEDLDGARRLLEAFREHSENPDAEEEEIEQHPLRRRYAHALPGIMSFYFPRETYHNDEVDDDPAGSCRNLCVVFFETAQEDRDAAGHEYYYQWLLTDQAEAGMDRIDEVHHEIQEDWGSVSQAIQKLQARGFTHARHLCMFGHAPASPGGAVEPEEACDPKLHRLIDALEKDDASTLARLLDEGLDPGKKLGDNDSLLAFCVKNDRKRCFDLLLSRGATDDELMERMVYQAGIRRDDPSVYTLPLLRTGWRFDEKGHSPHLTLGERVVSHALGVAMDPIGKTLLPEVLETSRSKADPRSYAKAFFRGLAQHLVAQRNPIVRDETQRLLEQDPGLLVDPQASPIVAMVVHRHYSVAVDWIIRHAVDARSIVIDGMPLMDYLQQRLAGAQSAGMARNRGGFMVVRIDRNNRVVPSQDEIEAEEIPRALARLASANRKSMRP